MQYFKTANLFTAYFVPSAGGLAKAGVSQKLPRATKGESTHKSLDTPHPRLRQTARYLLAFCLSIIQPNSALQVFQCRQHNIGLYMVLKFSLRFVRLDN